MQKITVRTKKRNEFIDITSEIQSIISKSKIENGVCLVFVPHTTAGITINENADPDVTSDIMSALEKIVPLKGNYSHSEGNSDAHTKASIMGSSVSVIIDKGSLMLGTWQGIYFAEFDGPRAREIWIHTVTTA
ncbi:MAG: secondary thiamine-phosphate synthase enzyme YjbQ [Elusimicrobia bacterium]|nr:secondary thiamine-phosphate synthase enzyme YjbQ [Elusimicrobiota bacterium]